MILLTLGSRTSTEMQGTYEAGLRRMASRLIGTAKDEVMILATKVKADSTLSQAPSDVATNHGISSVYPIKYLIDSATGAQINILGGSLDQQLLKLLLLLLRY